LALTTQKPRSDIVFAVWVLVGAVAVAIAAGGLFAWSGLYDVAATAKHSWPVEWLLHSVMRRSVALHAGTLAIPDLHDPVLIRRGAEHFSSGCAPCHGAPGQLASPIAQQMTPVPPGLYSANRDFTPSQLFWIVKHGVKMTAMPAWPAQGRSDEIWAMVAFLEELPHLTPPAYLQLTGQLTGAPASPAFLPQQPSPATAFDPARCAGCHGADGRGEPGVFPPLAGIDAARMERELRDYRDGSRPSGFMQPVAAAMSDDAISAAARYYAGLGTAGSP
jgi:cytochrome c553